jgi:hypothetical protein
MARERQVAARRRRLHAWASWTAFVAAVVAALFVALPSEPSRRGAPTELPLGFDAVARLLSPAASTTPPTRTQLVDALVALGPAALSAELAVLTGEIALPEVAPGTEDQPVHAAVLEMRREVLTAAIAELPRRELLDALRRHAQPSTPPEVRLALVRLAEEYAPPGSLELPLSIAEGFPPPLLVRGLIPRELEELVVHRLENQRLDRGSLRGLADRLAPHLRPLFVRAAARVPRGETTAFLFSMLGWDDELDVAVVRALGERCESLGAPVGESALFELRRTLDVASPPSARAALLVLGRLCDVDSAWSWIARLEDADPLVAAAARRALHGLAGVDFGADAEGWSAWLEGEEAWWESASPAVLADLDADDAGRVLAGITALLAHPAFARSFGAELESLVGCDDSPVAEAALAALVRLPSTVAAPGFVAALERADETGAVALAELRRRTGLALPADPDAWRAALGFE